MISKLMPDEDCVPDSFVRIRVSHGSTLSFLKLLSPFLLLSYRLKSKYPFPDNLLVNFTGKPDTNETIFRYFNLAERNFKSILMTTVAFLMSHRPHYL